MSGTLQPGLFGWRKTCLAVLASVVLSSASSASAAIQPVVPWVDQRPAKASAVPPLAVPCRAESLRAHLFLQGATGSLVGGVDFLNAGTRPCSLVGRPRVSFAGAAAGVTRWQVKKLSASQAPRDVLADPPGSLRALQPGKSATVELFWSNWCGPGSVPTGASGAPPDAIVFGLAGRMSITVPLTQAPRCDAPQDPSLVSTGPFMPTTRRLPESSRLPLNVAIIGSRPVRVKPGLRAFRVHRGELLRYRVAVTNVGRSTFRFAPSTCPVYIEQLTPSQPQAYVLNCHVVGTIAPHGTVLFAMQVRIPEKARLGVQSLTWELAPKTYEAPFAPATLWVVP